MEGLTWLSLGPGPVRRGLNGTRASLSEPFCHGWSWQPVPLTEFSPFSLGNNSKVRGSSCGEDFTAPEQPSVSQFMNAPFVVLSTTVRYNWSCSPLCLWLVSVSGDGWIPPPTLALLFLGGGHGPRFYSQYNFFDPIYIFQKCKFQKITF